MTFLGIAWFVVNVVIVMLLRPPPGQIQERLILRFPDPCRSAAHPLFWRFSFAHSLLTPLGIAAARRCWLLYLPAPWATYSQGRFDPY